MKFFSRGYQSHNDFGKSAVIEKLRFSVLNIIRLYVRYWYDNNNMGKQCAISFTCLLLAFLMISPQIHSETMRLTIYDDGRSCPANCDAHVVFDRSLNGTIFAHDPISSLAPFKKCALNTLCQICFDDRSNSSCMTATYRGNGPHPKTFDFTPEFYKQNCSNPAIPAELRQHCKSLAIAAKALDMRTNCIANLNDPKCVALIKKANSLQAADLPLYEKCKRDGETNFNKNRPVAQQRSNDCAYEKKGTGGPNSSGKTWKRLLPGACRPGTFVGRDGLDCCTGNTFSDGPLGSECKGFYK
ncbi:MAG: hypothetical protein PHD43_20500 [Methylococcales bacterium]|nr:hypothetical protein [Methylococcales bacterium]